MQFHINVGHYVKRGQKIASAGSFPLTLKENASEDDVLSAAVRKHQTFNSLFNPTLNYKLVHKDLRVADKIPGSDEVFSVKAYKDNLGISYSRMRLYIIDVDLLEGKLLYCCFKKKLLPRVSIHFHYSMAHPPCLPVCIYEGWVGMYGLNCTS